MAPITKTVALLAFSQLLFLSAASANKASSTITSAPAATSQVYAAMTSEGCFSSSGDFVDQGSYTYQSSGWCQKKCVALGKPVLGLSQGSNCWCGDLLPAADTQVDDSQCNTPCQGYSQENCGGASAWTVWLTGLEGSVGSDSGNSSSGSSSGTSSGSTTDSQSSSSLTSNTPSSSDTPSSASPITSVAVTATQAAAITTMAPQIITVSGSTVVRTMAVTTVLATPTAESKPVEAAHSTNKAGIAAGVVVGIVAFLALLGGVYFFLRRRQSQQAQRGHRRASSFDGGFPGTTNMHPTLPRLSTMNDSRLDPRVMTEKRQSGVSVFADNQDYSRRILQVANPDNS